MDDSFVKRANERRSTWTGYVARSFDEAAAHKRSIDDAIPCSERVELVWALVCAQTETWGSDASEYRLDRTLARVERGRR